MPNLAIKCTDEVDKNFPIAVQTTKTPRKKIVAPVNDVNVNNKKTQGVDNDNDRFKLSSNSYTFGSRLSSTGASGLEDG